MSEFKIGDRVRLTEEAQARPGVLGEYGPGTIIGVDEDAYTHIDVEFDYINGHPLFEDDPTAPLIGSVRAEQIELVESA